MNYHHSTQLYNKRLASKARRQEITNLAAYLTAGLLVGAVLVVLI